jgi:hypothetical protein
MRKTENVVCSAQTRGMGARFEKDCLTFDRLGEEAQMEVEGD